MLPMLTLTLPTTPEPCPHPAGIHHGRLNTLDQIQDLNSTNVPSIQFSTAILRLWRSDSFDLLSPLSSDE